MKKLTLSETHRHKQILRPDDRMSVPITVYSHSHSQLSPWPAHVQALSFNNLGDFTKFPQDASLEKKKGQRKCSADGYGL